MGLGALWKGGRGEEKSREGKQDSDKREEPEEGGKGMAKKQKERKTARGKREFIERQFVNIEASP